MSLDRALPTGKAAGEGAGAGGRLGAWVCEPPLGLAEAPRQLVGDDDSVLDGLREVGAALDLPLDGVDDLRVGVADHHDAEAVVKVDVFVAVHVPHKAALAVLDEDRLRRGVLEGRRDAPREHLSRVFPQLLRARTRLAETLLFDRGELENAGLRYFSRRGGSHRDGPHCRALLARTSAGRYSGSACRSKRPRRPRPGASTRPPPPTLSWSSTT